MRTATAIILGCGNSEGTPAIGNDWGACDSSEPKNRRTRPSLYVSGPEGAFIVDTGPDLREQINRERIEKIDAVLYTHAHGDHINGIDEIRNWVKRSGRIMDVIATPETASEMKTRFAYNFTEPSRFYPSPILMHETGYGERVICGMPVTLFEQDHYTCKSVGLRIGDFAYSTDVADLDDIAVQALQGIKTWVVDAAGYRAPVNHLHFTLEKLVSYNERIGALEVYITHLTPWMDYGALKKELPVGYAPAYDGQSLEIRF